MREVSLRRRHKKCSDARHDKQLAPVQSVSGTWVDACAKLLSSSRNCRGSSVEPSWRSVAGGPSAGHGHRSHVLNYKVSNLPEGTCIIHLRFCADHPQMMFRELKPWNIEVYLSLQMKPWEEKQNWNVAPNCQTTLQDLNLRQQMLDDNLKISHMLCQRYINCDNCGWLYKLAHMLCQRYINCDNCGWLYKLAMCIRCLVVSHKWVKY